MLRFFAFFFAIVTLAEAIPVDNGVEGDPEIECGPTTITVNFNTINPFEGHVYVKGLYATPGCRSDAQGRQVAGITLPFDSCGVSRQRSLNPRGVFVSTTVVISFHPLFLTKVDRAYRIQCFYMEADKTVDTELEVSAVTTGFQSEVVPMPVCRYEILDGSPTGPVIQFAIVGQQVYHKWTCDTETTDTFCMIVHSCYVDDVIEERVDLIGPDGCANDIYLLNNPEYLTDLMAGVEAHVFKFADRPQLYFQCQVAILVKEPNEECPRPSCPVPEGRGGPRPAGPAPPPPPNPWPLSPGSIYLPIGTGQVPHGPGDPAANFAPAPGRPDPSTFHQAGAPFAPVVGGVSPRRIQPGRRRPRPLPFRRRRPQDAPALQVVVDVQEKEETPELEVVDLRENKEEKRNRRDVNYDEKSVGTVDVGVEISTFDIEENRHTLPSSLVHQAPVPVGISRRPGGSICFSAPTFSLFVSVSLGLVLGIASISSFILIKGIRSKEQKLEN